MANRFTRLILTLLTLSLLGCQDALLRPELEPSFARGGKPGPPGDGGGGEDPAGPEDRFRMVLGHSAPLNDWAPDGEISGYGGGIVPTGGSMLMISWLVLAVAVLKAGKA